MSYSRIFRWELVVPTLMCCALLLSIIVLIMSLFVRQRAPQGQRGLPHSDHLLLTKSSSLVDRIEPSTVYIVSERVDVVSVSNMRDGSVVSFINPGEPVVLPQLTIPNGSSTFTMINERLIRSY